MLRSVLPGWRLCALRAALLVAGLLVLLPALAPSARAQEAPPGASGVDVLDVRGPLDETILSYVGAALDKAERDGAEAVVLQLDSTGTLGIDAGALAHRVATSPVPVVVWVGPPGARASGGARTVAEAAHVLGVAPGAVLGPARPADLSARAGVRAGDESLLVVPDGTTSDVVPALPDGLSADEVQVVDESAAVARGRADFMAATLADVLRQLDGRAVTVGSPAAMEQRTLDVDPVTTSVRFNNQGLIGRVLHTVANPTLAYLLLVAGALAILFELFQPGFGVAGLSGLAMGGLSVYGLTVLPMRWWALGLLVAGLLLLATDLALAGLGALTATGTAALATGSFLLFDVPALLRPPPWLLIMVVAFNVVFFVVIMTTVLRAQGGRAMAGAERVIGKVGVVRSMLNPEGHVFVEGALWRARAPAEAGKVKTGTTVRVVAMNDGLALDVELVEAADAAR